MDTSDRDITLIQKFLEDALSSIEQREFQLKLKDKKFKNELLFQSKMLDELVEIDTNKIRQDIKQPIKPSLTKLTFRLCVLLLMLLILGLSCFKIFESPSPQPMALADKYFQEYPMESGTRGYDSETIESALLCYGKGDYVKALELFNALENTELNEMYKGSIHYQLGKHKEASVIFKKLKNSRSLKIKENAEWYLCLSTLALDKPYSSKVILEKIAKEPAHRFYAKAGELQKEIGI